MEAVLAGVGGRTRLVTGGVVLLFGVVLILVIGGAVGWFDAAASPPLPAQRVHSPPSLINKKVFIV